jgi:large subunit ribosomal protein L30
LAQALLEEKVKLKDLKIIKPVFRLHPPKKGFKRSVKKMFNDGGELGYRGPEINELLLRMI